MADVHDQQTRSRNMAAIRDKNTKPELLVRKALFARGFRYRLHDPKLPGKPDLVFPRYNAVIQINGCFWHGHDCHLFKWPATRQDWWHNKINRTREVDDRSQHDLNRLGWRVLTVWECALKGKTRLDSEELMDDIADWLSVADSNYQLAGTNSE